MDSSSDLLKLYVCFHDDDTSGSSDPRVLDGIALQLHKCVGPYIQDSHHLQTIMRQISDPSKIESALDHEHISRYRPEPTQDTGIIGDRNAVIKEDFELLILCNFRKDEYVKYCDKDGVIKATMITGICKNISASNPVAQAMPPVLDLITKDDIKLPNVSCLLVCKYILAGQRSAIQSQLSTSSSQPTATSETSEKVVLLKLPLDNQEKFIHYVRDVVRSFSVDVQKYFAIERLLFQIHYWCVIDHKLSQKMAALMDGFLQCIRSELDQSKEENKEFFQKQVAKVDAMLGRNQPVVDAGSSQEFPYSAHSSWTARPSQGTHGLPCSSYWSPAPPPASTSATAPSSQVPSYSRPPGTGPGRSMPRYALEPEPSTSLSDAVMWLQQAWRDLNLAQHLLPSTAVPRQRQDHGYPEAVCFYSHEVVEKTLKAVFLAYCGLRHSLASYHHIVDLCEILSTHPNCPESIKEVSLRSHVLFVSRHGDCCRFPDSNLPPAPPMHTHSVSTAKEVLHSASTFLRTVAELEIFLQVFPTSDLNNIVLPEVDTDYPPDWNPLQRSAWELYTVSRNSAEFIRIAKLFHGTLPGVQIHCIERIQNKELWDKYKEQRRKIERDVDLRDTSEKMLFHGTRGTPPEMIYGSETGFDMRFSRNGLWGYGNYFAVNAQYSLNYAYNKGNNQLQMFVARVSPGASKSHGHQPVPYVVPPERETTGLHLPGQVRRRYNSVNAFTNGSEIYITYEHHLAYPEYLITFQR
jgi:HEPN domain-containing protein